jgi:hypothetical protein
MAGYRCDCGLAFSGCRPFDLHRIGDYEQCDRKGRVLKPASRHCLTAVELAAKGLVQNARGHWGRADDLRDRFSRLPAAKTHGSRCPRPAA